MTGTKKCLIFDLDGVVLDNTFPQVLCNRLGISKSDTDAFFSSDYRRCQTGELDLLVSIKPYLSKWGWMSSARAFIQFWFETDMKVNGALSDLIYEVAAMGTPIYIASNQEKYRATYLNQNLALIKKVTHVFYSYDLGCLKTDPRFFLSLDNYLNGEFEEVLYIDNDANNLKAAKRLGWVVFDFNSTTDCVDFIRRRFL